MKMVFLMLVMIKYVPIEKKKLEKNVMMEMIQTMMNVVMIV